MSDAARLQEFIQGAARLPVLPRVTLRLLNSLDSPDSSSREISGVIEADPALTARLLKLANSPFYGQRGMVSNIRNAVVVLGRKTIRSLALAVWTHTLRAQAQTPEEMQLLTPLLAHGLAAGVAARWLAERISKELGEDAFMAGLLHDIGRVALVAQMGGEYQTWILAAVQHTGVSLHDKEAAVLGFDHRALGAALMTSWGLPPFLVSVAEHHHDGSIDPQQQFFVATVALADYLATSMGFNMALDIQRSAPEGIAAFFGLENPVVVDEFLTTCLDSVRTLNAALELPG